MLERPSFLDLLLSHVLRSGDAASGQVQHIEIRHDDDCARWNGAACDCSPDIESGARIERRYGGNDG